MNVYFLVEGRKTERKVYPKWLSVLVPSLVRVEDAYAIHKNNYYLFSGNGYPSLLDNHLANAVADVNAIGKYDYFVICVDADDFTVAARVQEILDFMDKKKIVLQEATKLVIIVQNKCIETWLLGNAKIFKRNPQDPELKTYIEFYNVSKQDPELMESIDSNMTTATFHEDYLKALLAERNIQYTKHNPRGVTEPSYLDQLVQRTRKTKQLASFANFLDFCTIINAKIH
jgi:hypothetical protein